MDLEEEINFEDHEHRCRLCIKPIGERSKPVAITKAMENKFKLLTNQELHLTSDYSRIICIKCDIQFKKTFKYIQKVKKIQEELNNFVNKSSVKHFEEIQCKVEIPSEDDDEQPLLFDSYEFLKLNMKNEEEPVTPEKKKIKKQKGKNDMKEVCPECGVMLSSKIALRNHIDSIHNKVKRFFCDLCSYGGTIKYHIVCHMKSHLNPETRRVNKCQHCSFVSVSKQSLKVHEAAEHSGVIYTCHCGREFNHKNAMRIHAKRVHEGLRPHACQRADCEKSFFNKKELEAHIKTIHEPYKKDFSCDVCGAQFCTTKQLGKHKAYYHLAKFECSFKDCDKSFISKTLLERHFNTHTGNRDQICHLCEKAYFSTRDLQRHLDVVHKQTVYLCEFCTYTNSRKDYLGNHLRSSHNMDAQQRSEVLKRVKFIKNPV